MQFRPPGLIDDFARSARADELAAGWHAVVDSWLTRGTETTDGLFFNPAAAGAPTDGATAPIVWDAFPLVIRNWFDGQPDGDRLTFEAAETLRPTRYNGRPLRAVRNGRLAEELEVFSRQQDEYCEWAVERRDGEISRVVFTSEGPEYWEFLASGTAPFFPDGDPRRELTAGDPDLVLALYREHVSPEVAAEDLFWPHDVAVWTGTNWVYFARAGEYNRLNEWTTTRGLMHLTHPANTLAGEVRVAAAATVLRTVADDAASFACCAGFADVNRSSDPLIGYGVNQAARAGNLVSLADPMGLYIAGMNTGALSDPSAWSVTRGSAEDRMILRARVDVAPGTELTVGGLPLEWGGQLVQHIGMILTGLLAHNDGQQPGVRDCAVRCCTHPERRSFRTTVPIAGDCADVRWEELEPYLPGTRPAPAPLRAALTAGDDADEPVGPGALPAAGSGAGVR